MHSPRYLPHDNSRRRTKFYPAWEGPPSDSKLTFLGMYYLQNIPIELVGSLLYVVHGSLLLSAVEPWSGRRLSCARILRTRLCRWLSLGGNRKTRREPEQMKSRANLFVLILEAEKQRKFRHRKELTTWDEVDRGCRGSRCRTTDWTNDQGPPVPLSTH